MSAKQKKQTSKTPEIINSKARHKYHIGEKFEAGIALKGTEVKSIRLGKAQISEAFIRVEKGNAVLYHAHIDEYSFGGDDNHNPTRPRRLLLHKKEIQKIQAALEQGGEAVIPLRMYFKEALVKLEIAICRGKKLYDKREDLKKKDAMREAERAMKDRNRRS